MKWEEVKIKDIAVVKKGSYITKKEANLGPYPVILGGKEPAYYIDKYNHQGKAIVISRSGASAGFVSFWNEDIFVTDGFLVEPIGDVSYEYMYYLLKSKQDILQILQGGSAIPHVTPTIIYSICVNLPPKDVRERIGKVLKSYDDLIENNQKQIKLLEEAAQRLYKEWFVDLRFPGHEDVEIVDGLPKGWERTTIGKYISVRSGYAFKSDWWQKDGYPVVKIKDITKNTIDLSELDYVGTDKLKKASEFKLNKHDLVIAMTGATIGKIGLVPEVDDLYANQRVGKLFLKDCIDGALVRGQTANIFPV